MLAKAIQSVYITYSKMMSKNAGWVEKAVLQALSSTTGWVLKLPNLYKS
jgi:hypothetical protein